MMSSLRHSSQMLDGARSGRCRACRPHQRFWNFQWGTCHEEENDRHSGDQRCGLRALHRHGRFCNRRGRPRRRRWRWPPRWGRWSWGWRVLEDFTAEVAAGMAEAVATMVPWPTWVMGGVAMHRALTAGLTRIQHLLVT